MNGEVHSSPDALPSPSHPPSHRGLYQVTSQNELLPKLPVEPHHSSEAGRNNGCWGECGANPANPGVGTRKTTFFLPPVVTGSHDSLYKE